MDTSPTLPNPYHYAQAWRQTADDGDKTRDEQLVRETLARPDYTHSFPPPVLQCDNTAEIYRAGRAVVEGLRQVFEVQFGGSVRQLARFLEFDSDHIDLIESVASTRTVDIALAFARPDFIYTDDGLKLVECNFATTLGGMNTIDPYNNAVSNTSFYHSLPDLTGLDWVQPQWSAVVASFSNESHDARSRPVLFYALASRSDMNYGFAKFRAMASQSGYAAITGLFNDIEIRGGAAWINDVQIDMIVSGFTWSEFKKSICASKMHDVVVADANGAVTFLGSPVSALFDSKMLLTRLSPEWWTAQRQPDLLPETTLARHGTDKLLNEQDEWVLKPSSEFGGAGVAIGRTTSSSNWRQLVGRIAAGDAPAYIAQRLVKATAFDGPISTEKIVLSVGPLILGGRAAGVLARQKVVTASESLPLLNQKQGATGSSILVAPK